VGSIGTGVVTVSWKERKMQDLFIVGLGAFYLGVLIGFAVALKYLGKETPEAVEDRKQRDIERRLLGKPVPRHRAATEPAVVRQARMLSTKGWSNLSK
jgi:hypothetical protein